MRGYGVMCGVASLLLFATSEASSAADAVPATFKEKLSYSIGQQIGGNLRRDKLDLDAETAAKGMKDAFSGASSLMTEAEMRDTLLAFQKTREAEKAMWRKTEGEKNRREGKAFLDKNRKAKGVVETASGLQYRIEKQGSGPRPSLGDEVKVHYRGRLLDGSEFDSSYGAGEATVFGLDSVIPGWKEGLQLMPIGSKYTFYIPAGLAYGAQGAGDVIGPDAVLQFEVELLDIRTARR